jgi:hypothetical protein
MPIKECSSNKLDIIENDETLEIVPRRHVERRSLLRRATIKPKIVSSETVRLLRKQDKSTHLVFRDGDRRKQNRRTSKPSFLIADNIVILRKK